MQMPLINQGAKLELQNELFIVDANLESFIKKNGPAVTVRMVKELLLTLDMLPLDECKIFPAVDLRAPGFSFIQPITTSHISGHYFEKPGKKPHLLDVYSCKTFDWEKVLFVLNKYFKLAEWKGNCISRFIEKKRTYFEVQGTGEKILKKFQLR